MKNPLKIDFGKNYLNIKFVIHFTKLSLKNYIGEFEFVFYLLLLDYDCIKFANSMDKAI